MKILEINSKNYKYGYINLGYQNYISYFPIIFNLIRL